MNQKELCAKLRISGQPLTSKQLAAGVAKGLPRAKVKGKWEYEEASVLEWIASQSDAKSVSPPSSTSTNTVELEVIARTMDEAVRMLAELGLRVHKRTLATWLKEPGFPGRPGRPGKPDAYLPCRAILAWLGATGRKGDAEESEESPKRQLLEIRVAKEKIELAKLQKQIVDRGESEGVIDRITAVFKTSMESLPDELAALLPADQKANARKIVVQRCDRMLETIADIFDQYAQELDQQ